MKNLSNKNLTEEEIIEKISTPKENKKKKRKRVYPGFPDTGLKTGPSHPLILKLGGFPDGKKFI